MMVFQSALNGMGADAIAAYTACNKLETFVVMPMYSIAVAMVTFYSTEFRCEAISENSKRNEGFSFELSLFQCCGRRIDHCVL